MTAELDYQTIEARSARSDPDVEGDRSVPASPETRAADSGFHLLAPQRLAVSVLGAGFVLPCPANGAGEPVVRCDTSRTGAIQLPDAELLALARYGRREAKRADRFSILAVAAARQALCSADLSDHNRRTCGVVVGTMVGGWSSTEPQLRGLHTTGLASVSPYLASTWFPAAPQGQVSIHLGMTGYAKTIATNRTAFLHALHVARLQICRGRASCLLAGAAEAPKTPFVQAAHAGFHGDAALPLAEGAGFLLLGSRRKAQSAGPEIELRATAVRRMRGIGPSCSWADALKGCRIFADQAVDFQRKPSTPHVHSSRRILVLLVDEPGRGAPLTIQPIVAQLLSELGANGSRFLLSRAPADCDALSCHCIPAVRDILRKLALGHCTGALVIAVDGNHFAAAYFEACL